MAECITIESFMAFFCPEFRSIGCTSAGQIEFADTGTIGDTITIGTLTATAVMSPRVAGTLTWAVGGTAAASAASFAAMLADSLLTEIVAGVLSGATIALTSIATGYLSLLVLSSSDPTAYTLTAFAGGTTMVDTILAASCRLIGACFGSMRSLAQFWLTAHMLAGWRGLDVGVQTSATINAISAGFSTTPFGPADAVFAGTSYGRQFLLIRAMVPRFGFALISGPGGGSCGC